MENKIDIIFDNEKISINENNPDIKSIIEYVVNKIDEIDENKIEIKTNPKNEEFDSEGLKAILVESIADFKEKITLDTKLISEAQVELDKLKKLNSK